MSKIQFTLEAWLKDKSQKVETRDGRIVHNIWPVKEPLIFNGKRAEVCALIDGEEDALVFFEGGRYLPTTKDTDSPFDLFIVTPEEELTEFEMAIHRHLNLMNGENLSATELLEETKGMAAELLALAREELFANDTVLKEYAQVSREDGKAEALKDLPRWRDDDLPEGCTMIDIGVLYGFDFIRRHRKLLRISDLSKLPGFKED